MSRPPSQAVIEAVEHALGRQDLIDGRCGCEDPRCGENARLSEDVYVVAKAAMDAARPIILREVADECEADARDWYGTDIFRDVDSADLAAVRSAMQAKGKDIDNLSAWYFRRALIVRADILRRMADELTDETGEQ